MVLCPTLTVVEAVPDIILNAKGFGVNGAPIQDTCTRNDIKGKAIELVLNLTADKNAYADININYKDPGGTAHGFAYRDTVINAGTANYLFTTNDSYVVGTYALEIVNITNIRSR